MRNRVRRDTVTPMARRLPVPAVDLILAVIALALALAELFVWNEWSTEPRAVQIVGVAVICCALAFRRAAPLVASAVALVGVVVLAVGGDPPQLLAAGIAGVVIAYAVAAELDGRELLAAAGLLAGAVVVRDIADPALNGFDIAIDLLFFVGAFAVGRVVRRRQKQVELVSVVAADLQEDAVRRERERIARELHDVIAHGMSVMVVQADAARHGLPPGDDATRAALEQIERTGRDSLREMRRLLGLLRDDDAAGAALEPQPGLAGVDALVTSVRQAGLPVELRVVGEAVPLSPGVDVAAYRILQEALTNALRHAGPARATVEIAYGENAVSLKVEDTGRENGSASGGGRGLVGMRERVRLYGGSLDVGPCPRGFAVFATLPLEAHHR